MGLTELNSQSFVVGQFIARFYTNQHFSQRTGK